MALIESTSPTTEELTTRLSGIRDRIALACGRVGRDPESVRLVGVTKTFPTELVRRARAAGLRDFGENRVQEFLQKADEVPGELDGGDIRWHLIGHLQRNKAKDIVERASLFHALDSRRLAAELDRRLEAVGRTLPCLVQVNVSGEESKFGIEADELKLFLADIDSFRHLEVRGLMTIAAPADDPEEVRPQFRLLRDLLREHGTPEMNELSMGMSGDFEVAVEEGATIIRIGSLIFGEREA
jgi:PLP dependent protein